MFFDDHKKIATAMRGRRDGKGNREAAPTAMKPELSQTEPGVMDGKHVAMQDFMAAHKEGSAQKMSDAMSNFMAIHAGSDAAESSSEG